MNINIERNAESIINMEIAKKEFVAVKKALSYFIENNFGTMFNTTLQIYILKLGLIMSSIVGPVKMHNGGKYNTNAYGAICYMYDYVLDNSANKKIWTDLGMNTKGNIVKHTLNSVGGVDIKKELNALNSLINALYDKLKIKSILKMKENTLVQKKQTSIGILMQERDNVKMFMLGKNRVCITLLDRGIYDPYTKVMHVGLNIRVENHSNDVFKIEVLQNKKLRANVRVKAADCINDGMDVDVAIPRDDCINLSRLDIDVNAKLQVMADVEKSRLVNKQKTVKRVGERKAGGLAGIFGKKEAYGYDQTVTYQAKEKYTTKDWVDKKIVSVHLSTIVH